MSDKESVWENDKVMIGFYLVMTIFAVLNTFILMNAGATAAAVITAISGPVWGFSIGCRATRMRDSR
ncbi:hypothetical protein KA005_12430 [bacterium]|nr:hypothetical protein [bacterium]